MGLGTDLADYSFVIFCCSDIRVAFVNDLTQGHVLQSGMDAHLVVSNRCHDTVYAQACMVLH